MILVVRFRNGKKNMYGYLRKNDAVAQMERLAQDSDEVIMINLDNQTWASKLTLKNIVRV